jgi:hypothetical protein
MKDFSPFYKMYMGNKENIDKAIKIATKASALKMGKDFNKVFSLRNNTAVPE